MLGFLDFLFSIIHVILILFNLSGWIWRRTRRVHFFVILLTAASWVGLGFWFGFGYCPVTDWQWQVKRRLGETNLIKYLTDRIIDGDINPAVTDTITVLFFVIAAGASVYVNFIRNRRQ